MMIIKLACVTICSALIMVGFPGYRGAASGNLRPVLTFPDDEDSRPASELSWAVNQPSPDKESTLRRFIEECVLISKGTLKVPRGQSDSMLSNKLMIERGYRMSRFETTQELYQLVMGVNPSRWTGPRNSVEQVTYSDALNFCRKLTVMLRSRGLLEEGQVVRLPTDAEWEYACRAGAKTKYCFGNATESKSGKLVLDEYAWHTGNAAGNDPSVGMLKPNRWKLADVHGYLWEFTQTTSEAPAANAADVRIWGGSWRASPLDCGCSSIRQVSPTWKAPDLGFRCVIQ